MELDEFIVGVQLLFKEEIDERNKSQQKNDIFIVCFSIDILKMNRKNVQNEKKRKSEKIE